MAKKKPTATLFEERAAFQAQHPRCVKCNQPASVVVTLGQPGGGYKERCKPQNWRSVCLPHFNEMQQKHGTLCCRIGGGGEMLD